MNQTTQKTRKTIMLVAAASLIVLFTLGYNLISRYMPKRSGTNVKDITSSDARSKIFIHTDTDGTDDGIEKLISLMNNNDEPFYMTNNQNGMIGVDDVVIIKTNSQWDQRGGTNVDLVESVINAILSHPDGFSGEIVIADNGQDQYGSDGNGGSMNWDKPNSADRSKTILDLVAAYADNSVKISAYLWDDITTNKVDEFSEGDMEAGFILYDKPDEDTKITVSYPKFTTEFGTDISFKMGIWDQAAQSYDSDRLKVINMPVLKTHMQYGVTGAVKAYMGVPSDKLTRNSHTTVGIGSMGTLMAETRMPSLNIMDAIYINANTDSSSRGPATGYDEATFAKTVLISTDPIALDYYAAGNILYPAIEAAGDSLELKHQKDSDEPGSFGYWLKLSMLQLQEGGHRCVIDEDRMDIFSID